MGQVIGFRPKTTIHADADLIALMQRAQREVFEGNRKDFETAYSEAMAAQVIELADANDGEFPDNLAEELADAMRGVLLQWLGEHKCYSEEEFPPFLRQAIGLE